MTIRNHAIKTSHRRTERRIIRRDVKEQLSEVVTCCACKAVKK